MGHIKQAQFEKKSRSKAGGAKAKGQKSYAEQAEYRGYVGYERGAPQKAQFEAWVGDVEERDGALLAAIEMGYKFSVVFDGSEGTYKASFYMGNAERPDGGLGISAFSDDMWEAVWAVTFFLAVHGGYTLDNPVFTPPNSHTKRSFWG